MPWPAEDGAGESRYSKPAQRRWELPERTTRPGSLPCRLSTIMVWGNEGRKLDALLEHGNSGKKLSKFETMLENYDSTLN